MLSGETATIEERNAASQLSTLASIEALGI